jgi:endoglucanase
VRVKRAARSTLAQPLPRSGRGVFIVLLLFFAVTARAEPPAERLHVLRHGISVTGWFRFPASADPAALRAYLGDPAIADLRGAGFSFVRLPVQPEFMDAAPEHVTVLIEVVRRLQHAGLGVVIDAHPATWHLETSEPDRAALFRFWRILAPALRALDPRLTFPELLNEPVFPHAPEQWRALQDRLLSAVRSALPQATVVLTGNDWGSVAGLAALLPVADGNVVYSFHFYQPAELTSLAAWRPGLDRAVLARLPFPDDPATCARLADGADAETADVVRFYCSQHWNAARIAAEIGKAAGWGQRNHAAVLLGEFGASAALVPPARVAWLQAVQTACAEDGIGWALWGYDDVMGFALPRPAGPRPALDHGVLRALGLGGGGE